ncbi:hypothetical protein OS965_30000 [Streptomyces sp. H27-G5]|uniref:hypothetical protein n=1 Tax=Streptomyces sp. H27-G5 TaxID=2996698 RepID=UPI00226FA6B9|nr:hypothetical protein [Streptomyces sp. H27-G5]MCY0922344.1 hypothetical protein [Streptomyces sp. H27-G5]
MLMFTSLPRPARTALIALIGIPVFAITVLDPDQLDGPKPLGPVVTRDGGRLTVRTADGQVHEVIDHPAALRLCDPGRTYPACSR